MIRDGLLMLREEKGNQFSLVLDAQLLPKIFGHDIILVAGHDKGARLDDTLMDVLCWTGARNAARGGIAQMIPGGASLGLLGVKRMTANTTIDHGQILGFGWVRRSHS